MQLTPGTTIDRYTIESVLGEGGMAVVYRARHVQLGSLHAIKVLKVPAVSIQDRLLQEGRVQAQLRHPNIVSVTDVVEVMGAPGLVMEFIAGSSLDTFLHENKLTLEQADDLARGILAGVTIAHKAGLIHRDLKPANILLGTSPNGIVPKITDFGLAKLLDHGAGPAGATRSGMAMGTPAYMAPEQIESAKGVDQRADIFSLGAILYELVGGERPFQGTSTLAILNAVASGEHRPLEELVADVPKRMVDAIQGALEVDPENRIASCADLMRIWVGDSAGSASIWDGSTVETIQRIVRPPTADSSESETYYPQTFGALEASMPSVAPDDGPSALPDTLPTPPIDEPSTAPSPSSAAPLIALAGVAAAVVVVALFFLWPAGSPRAEAELPEVPVEAQLEEPEPVEPTDLPEPTDVPEPATPAPVVAPTTRAEPTETEPAVEEDPDRPPLTFLSVPSGATVLLDGLEVGVTPLRGYTVPKGRHKVEMMLGDAEIKEKIGVGKRSARTFVWKVASGEWLERDEAR